MEDLERLKKKMLKEEEQSQDSDNSQDDKNAEKSKSSGNENLHNSETSEEVKKKGFFGKIKGKKDGKEKREEKKGIGLFRKKNDGMKQNIVRNVDLKEGNAAYDENVITSDEFSLIESDEKQKEEELKEIVQVPEEKISEANVVDQLVMKIERIDGRISAIDEMNKAVNERITGLSEEIGELRSSILEKERTINEIESQAKKVMDAFEEIEPETFRKELEKKEEEIVKTQASIESLLLKQKEIKDTLDKLQGVMEKVKSFENLVEMTGKINEKLSQIEESKKYTSRLASKVENIFSELNNRMKEFKSSMEKVEMNDETIKEMMKSVDVMEIKVEKVVAKDQLEKIEKDLKEEISNNKMEIEDKLYDLKDFLEDVVTKAGGVKLLKTRDIMPWRIELENRMSQIEKLVANSRKSFVKTGDFRMETKDLGKDKPEGMTKGFVKEREPKSTHQKQVFKPKYMEEVPPYIEKWISENLNKGYSVEALKESLRKNGNDPSIVDKFFSGVSGKKQYENQYVIG